MAPLPFLSTVQLPPVISAVALTSKTGHQHHAASDQRSSIAAAGATGTTTMLPPSAEFGQTELSIDIAGPGAFGDATSSATAASTIMKGNAASGGSISVSRSNSGNSEGWDETTGSYLASHHNQQQQQQPPVLVPLSEEPSSHSGHHHQHSNTTAVHGHAPGGKVSSAAGCSITRTGRTRGSISCSQQPGRFSCAFLSTAAINLFAPFTLKHLCSWCGS